MNEKVSVFTAIISNMCNGGANLMIHQDNPPLEDVLMHYGIKRRSGRYPYGSGDSPYQHSGDLET